MSSIRNSQEPEQRVTLAPTLGLLPVLMVSALVAGEAQAQEEEAQDLGTIILKAGADGAAEAASEYKVTNSANEKVLAPLVDTPKTIKVITRREMIERGQTTVEDVLRSTPGVTLGTGEGGNPAGLNPVLRGNSASNDVMIDGFRSPLRTTYESFNMNSIEITKGPGGTAAGTGSTGGTINLTSKTPEEEDFTDAALSFGTGAYKRATLDMNRNFGDLGLRLNLMAQDANSLGGRKGKESGRYGIAPSLSYNFSDATKLTAGLYYFKDEDLQDYGVPLSNDSTVAGHRGAGTPEDPWQPVDVSPENFYGIKDRDLHDGTSKSAFVRLDHEFENGLRWSNRLAFSDFKNIYVLTRPRAEGAFVNRGGIGRHFEGESVQFNSQLTGETQIGGFETRFALGVDLANTTNERFDISLTDPAGFDPLTPLGNPDPNTPWGGTITYGDLLTQTKIKTRGIYALGTVEFDPQWEASFGLRYDTFDTRQTDADGRETGKNDANFWNGNIGLVYKPAENGSIYASIGTSANPGGESNGVGGSPDSSLNTLDPERAYSYEIGTKWSLFDERLFLSAAIFRTQKDNARATNADGEVENIGKNRAQGFEFDIAGQVTDQWAVSAGYSYIDSKIIDGGHTCSEGVCSPSANTGSRTAGVPMHSFSLWSTYAFNDDLVLGGGATFIGKRYMNADRTVVLPDQVRVDLMAKYKFTDATAIQFNANNIFDEQLYQGNRGNGWANIEPGRNFTLTLSHSF